tara:strand:- start:9667 stop:9774 length:108 start_codon:yes stop_codon:yes gene_type:complete
MIPGAVLFVFEEHDPGRKSVLFEDEEHGTASSLAF